MRSLARTRTLRSALAVAALAFAAACGAEPGSSPDPTPTPAPGDAHLSSGVQPILTAHCATSGCHDAATALAGLDLSAGHTWTDVVGVSGQMYPAYLRIDPGDPDASLIFRKINGDTDVGFAMPAGVTAAPPLSPDQIDVIRRWILAGAPND